MTDFSKDFNISNGNENYIIKISIKENNKKEKLLIQVNPSNDESVYYSADFSLEELIKLSKAFRACDSTKEAFEIIIKILGDKKASIKKNNTNNGNEIILGLKIGLLSGEEKEVLINLIKHESNANKSNEELIQRINILTNENQNLKEKIQIMKKEIKDKDKVIETLKNELQKNNININYGDINSGARNLEESNESYGEDKESDLGNEVIITDIIKSQDELDFIEERLKEIKYFQNKNLKYQLIYKGTKDGDKSSTFHYKCDGIRSTLTLVKTKKGLRFGGYTSENWNQIGGYGKVDPNAFCFSFDLKKIYNSQKNQLAILCSDSYGPYFKGTNTIFGIYNNFFTKGGWCDYTTFSFSFGKFDKNFEITNGEQNFDIEDVEIFKVYC